MMRYITTLSLLLLAALSFSSALAGPRYARIVVGTREVALSPRAVVDEDSVYAPADVLKALGADFAAGKHKVSITLGDATTELDIHTENGYPMVSMDDVAKTFNLDRNWDDGSSTLILLAKLVSVEYDGGVVIARTTAPVKVIGTRLWQDRNIISIDLGGTKVATSAKTFRVDSAGVSQLRVGQYQDTTARVAIDLAGRRPFRVLTSGTNRETRIAIGGAQKTAPKHVETTVAQPKPVVSEPEKPVEPKAVSITDIKPEPTGDARLTVRVSMTGKPSFTTLMLQSPKRIAVDIKNAKLEMKGDTIKIDHPLLKDLTTEERDGSVRLLLDATDNPRFFVEPDGNDLLLKLGKQSMGGKLTDKIVVIDPGHGGNQPGAHGGNVLEKDVNFALASHVKQALEEAGVHVVMTREGDTYLGLPDRPAVADRVGADLFISIHCNALFPDARSGTEVYYHNGQESGRELAMAIHDGLMKTTGMKDNGVKRDTMLYRSGLAVLRAANVPAILIESGYIDCAADRGKLCDESFQQKFAEGVLDGLRFYVEGTTISEGQ